MIARIEKTRFPGFNDDFRREVWRLGTIPGSLLGRLGFALVATRFAPHDGPNLGRCCAAERRRLAWIGFHAGLLDFCLFLELSRTATAMLVERLVYVASDKAV